jgi:DNA-binding NarL/FixJ family response regulator
MGARILLADDSRLMREGLASLMRHEPDMDLVGEAADGMESVSLARKLQPDLVVMDLTMPGLNGIDATQRILAQSPNVKVLCLSVHDEQQLVAAVIDAGASGYLLKNCAFEELARAVRTVMANQVYISPSITAVLVADFRARRGAATVSAFSRLTARERQIVQLLAEGYSTKEISERLRVSSKTVATHREHVMAKLQIHSIAQLTRYAIAEGLV